VCDSGFGVSAPGQNKDASNKFRVCPPGSPAGGGRGRDDESCCKGTALTTRKSWRFFQIFRKCPRPSRAPLPTRSTCPHCHALPIELLAGPRALPERRNWIPPLCTVRELRLHTPLQLVDALKTGIILRLDSIRASSNQRRERERQTGSHARRLSPDPACIICYLTACSRLLPAFWESA